MFCFLFFVAIRSHKCHHDELWKSLNIEIPKKEPINNHRILLDDSWEKIRIKFVYDWLDGTKEDKYKCTEENQSVQWGYLQPVPVCNKNDIIDDNKINVIKGTLENIRVYLEKLLQVIPARTPITLQNYEKFFEYSPLQNYSDTDLVLSVLARPYGAYNSILAQAATLSSDEFYRPTSGFVMINAARLPNEPSDITSDDNTFFMICLHEVIHALGFSNGYYKYFHPYGTNQVYKDPLCYLTKNGKFFTFLTTPKAHIFAAKRYGNDTFYGDDENTSCPAGIELEDGGASGTQISHLEARTFMTELMVGENIQKTGQFMRLTDATLAVLLDTGNYKVDYTLAQPLVWGNQESIRDQPIADFAMGPPQTTFPDGYFANSSETNDFTGFDYRFNGNISDALTDEGFCPNQTTGYSNYCNEDLRYTFYNPKKLPKFADSWVYDFQFVKYPRHVCPKDSIILPGASTENEPCFKFECHGYDSFDVYIKTETTDTKKTCNRENIYEKFNYTLETADKVRHVWCPDPERFCRTQKLYSMHFVNDPLDLSTKQLTDDTENTTVTTTTTEIEISNTTTETEIITTTTTEIETETNTTIIETVTTTTETEISNTTITDSETTTITTTEIEPTIITTTTHSDQETTTTTETEIITNSPEPEPPTQKPEPPTPTTEPEPQTSTPESQTPTAKPDEGGGSQKGELTLAKKIIFSVTAVVSILLIISAIFFALACRKRMTKRYKPITTEEAIMSEELINY